LLILRMLQVFLKGIKFSNEMAQKK